MSNNCGCSSDGSTIGATQRTLEAWIQPNGAGPLNASAYAMVGGDYPGIKISNYSRKRRGTRTPRYRRDAAQSYTKCGVKEAAPAANSITVEFAACGCGGYEASELVQCLLDIYQMEVCCSGAGGSFLTGWSKIKVIKGVSFESDDIANMVSFDNDDDNDVTISHPGEFDTAFTLYPLTVGEIAATSSQPTGTFIEDVIYSSERCAGGNCSDNCVEGWYAISREGELIYKANRTANMSSVAIPNWPAGVTKAALIEFQGKLMVLAQVPGALDQVFYTSLSSYGVPTTWSSASFNSATTNMEGFLVNGSHLYAYGIDTNQPVVFELTNAGVVSKTFFAGTANGNTIKSLANCGKNLVAVGSAGSFFYSGGCNNTMVSLSTSPTALDILTIGIQRSGEWWIGTGTTAHVYYTLDSGATWSEVSFAFTGKAGNVRSIVWANSSVGHILYEDTAGNCQWFTTFDGGHTWTDTTDRIATGLTKGTPLKMSTPCCKQTPTANVNNALIAGQLNGAGALWQVSIKSC